MFKIETFNTSFFLLVVVFTGCNEKNPDPAVSDQATTTTGQPPAASTNFTAEISGFVAGQVAGPGVVTFLPPRESAAGTTPGYFFIADDTGVRDLGITITIPSGSKPGTYELVSAHPMNAGKHFEVRVDQSIGSRAESFQKNTKGTITLEQFPDEGSNTTGCVVKGKFEFTTEGKGGEQLKATGQFDFNGR